MPKDILRPPIGCSLQFEEWRLLGCYRRVALVRTDVSKESSPSFIRVTRIGELGPTLAVTSNRSMVRRNIKKYQTLDISSWRASVASYS
jgi:hypothetical protein